MAVHQLFTVHMVDKSEFWHGVCSTIAQAILQKPPVKVESGYSSSFVFQHTIHAGAYCHKIQDIRALTSTAIRQSVTSYLPTDL